MIATTVHPWGPGDITTRTTVELNLLGPGSTYVMEGTWPRQNGYVTLARFTEDENGDWRITESYPALEGRTYPSRERLEETVVTRYRRTLAERWARQTKTGGRR